MGRRRTRPLRRRRGQARRARARLVEELGRLGARQARVDQLEEGEPRVGAALAAGGLRAVGGGE